MEKGNRTFELWRHTEGCSQLLSTIAGVDKALEIAVRVSGVNRPLGHNPYYASSFFIRKDRDEMYELKEL
ncbi:MAG: hypothetical protein LBB27_03055 [Tannerellaceae bacterium]|jgi:hypothetical protein|nr:hypothetical protein [Tannerellaceae bacterium]